MELLEPQLNFSPSGVIEPSDWGLILAEGPDAGSFLQGQLTNDVLLLPVGQSRFSGYCSAKGRLLASFIVLKLSSEKYLMVCHQNLIAATVKRLSMFVLRAKVKLTDASSDFQTLAYLGQAATDVSPALHAAAPWHVRQQAESYFIQLHPAKSASGSLARVLQISPNNTSNATPLKPESVKPISIQDWQMAEVLSGISMVQSQTSEAFVPQMLNYESVEGVSFKKGCYPGQEVVARSQFRGTLKRRAFIVSCNEPMQVGQEVFSSDDAEQACGMISSAAKLELVGSQQAQWWGIASLQLSAMQNPLHLGQAGGPAMQPYALPYPLLEDI
jgi:folate-binding protein YgfZ